MLSPYRHNRDWFRTRLTEHEAADRLDSFVGKTCLHKVLDGYDCIDEGDLCLVVLNFRDVHPGDERFGTFSLTELFSRLEAQAAANLV